MTDVDRHLSPNASDREIREIIGDDPGTLRAGAPLARMELTLL